MTSMPTASYPSSREARTVVPAPQKGSRILPAGTQIFTKIPHELQGLFRHMNSVLRIGVTEHTRQASHRSIHRHGAVTAPHDVFALLAETSFLRAAGHLIPNRRATPDPASPLQSVGDRRILPPVNEQTNRRSRFAGFSGVRKPFSHPSGPASLVPVDPRQNPAGHSSGPCCCIFV